MCYEWDATSRSFESLCEVEKDAMWIPWKNGLATLILDVIYPYPHNYDVQDPILLLSLGDPDAEIELQFVFAFRLSKRETQYATLLWHYLLPRIQLLRHQDQCYPQDGRLLFVMIEGESVLSCLDILTGVVTAVGENGVDNKVIVFPRYEFDALTSMFMKRNMFVGFGSDYKDHEAGRWVWYSAKLSDAIASTIEPDHRFEQVRFKRGFFFFFFFFS
jgi:hypothetical protein